MPPHPHTATDPGTHAAYMRCENLLAAAKVRGTAKYDAGPGAKAPPLNHLPADSVLRKRRKKIASAYVSRFAAAEYDRLLPEELAQAEREKKLIVAKAAALEAENMQLSADVEKLKMLLRARVASANYEERELQRSLVDDEEKPHHGLSSWHAANVLDACDQVYDGAGVEVCDKDGPEMVGSGKERRYECVEKFDVGYTHCPSSPFSEFSRVSAATPPVTPSSSSQVVVSDGAENLFGTDCFDTFANNLNSQEVGANLVYSENPSPLDVPSEVAWDYNPSHEPPFNWT